MPGHCFLVTLRLVAAADGGRRGPILDDHRASWNLGNTWHGEPTLDDGRVFLEERDELQPGMEGPARIEPLSAELWGKVAAGSVIAMQEGGRVVGYASVREIASPDYWSPAIAEFVMQARQFCDFVETEADQPREKRLAIARERLLALYGAGAQLPHVHPPEDIEAGETPPRPDAWAGFGVLDLYWEVFDPYEHTVPVGGSLSDDLLDVYGDLKRGLALWDRDAGTREDDYRIAAIWEWRFHFDCHWGDHAIDALRALHRACLR